MTTPTFTSSLRLEPLLPRHRRLLLTMFEDQRVWTYLDGSPADAEKTTTRFIDAAELSRSATGLGMDLDRVPPSRQCGSAAPLGHLRRHRRRPYPLR